MARELIHSNKIYEYEQEAIYETREVAGADGVVYEETITVQDHFHYWIMAEIEEDIVTNKSNTAADNNRAGVYLTTKMYVTSDTSDFLFSNNNSYTDVYVCSDNFYDYASTREFHGKDVESYKNELVTAGKVFSCEMQHISSVSKWSGVNGTMPYIYFNTDGSANLSYRARCYCNISGDIVGEIFGSKIGGETPNYTNNSNKEYVTVNLKPFNRGAAIITASNFTDEENPTVTYEAPIIYYPTISIGFDTPNLGRTYDELTSTQIAISLDGITPLIDYRDINSENSSYTFNLTDAEREQLRASVVGSDSVPIHFIIKTTIFYMNVKPSNFNPESQTHKRVEETFYSTVERILTVVGCNPSLNPTVKDIKSETLALTGDENTFIRYESMAEYAINAVASKNATIVSQSVTCGSKTISNLPYGVIDDVESGTFIFNVTDSRNMGASSSVFKGLVEYVKPTCYQKAEIEISGETGANIKITVNGSYFNGSFGLVDNTLKLEVRHTDDNGDMGAWKTLSGTPTYNGTTYKLEATLSGFNYGNSYVFQCRATDKLNFVESSQYTIRMLPVFDWSESDFNFNVPVNIDAEDLNMYGETIIRHSNTTNNTVLSASNGNIYIRPGGTDDTSGETIFYGNGNVKFNGTVTFADGSTGGGASDPTDAFADYVIEIGEEAMGSNGTWYWRKWNSGKAEAWGCRNFGNMAVTTAWGNLYRSAIFAQDFPDNVFIRTPDAININIVHANFGGWICKHEQTAPSAVTTGSFIFVRPASATVTPTNIGFYVVGEWK